MYCEVKGVVIIKKGKGKKTCSTDSIHSFRPAIGLKGERKGSWPAPSCGYPGHQRG